MTRPYYAPTRFLFFFFNDTATTEIYTLSLHDALPISQPCRNRPVLPKSSVRPLSAGPFSRRQRSSRSERSEEHTSELQSPCNLVCRLLLEKKKKNNNPNDCQAHIGYLAQSHHTCIPHE